MSNKTSRGFVTFKELEEKMAREKAYNLESWVERSILGKLVAVAIFIALLGLVYAVLNMVAPCG